MTTRCLYCPTEVSFHNAVEDPKNVYNPDDENDDDSDDDPGDDDDDDDGDGEDLMIMVSITTIIMMIIIVVVVVVADLALALVPTATIVGLFNIAITMLIAITIIPTSYYYCCKHYC